MVDQFHPVQCRKCGTVVNLPISAGGLTASIAPLAGWTFDTDNGWRCPDHIESYEAD